MNDIKINIPLGQSGEWRVEKFTISESAARMYNLQLTMHGAGYRRVEPGEFIRLMHNKQLVMSNTRAEINDHWEPIDKAKGNVLVNGLGLGVVVQECLNKDIVSHLTVIEISEDVIKLMGNHYLQMFPNRLTIINADALTYIPPKGVKYNVVWHDIWNDICTGNWEQYKLLHRKYGRKCDWQGSWARYEVMQHIREDKNDPLQIYNNLRKKSEEIANKFSGGTP